MISKYKRIPVQETQTLTIPPSDTGVKGYDQGLSLQKCTTDVKLFKSLCFNLCTSLTILLDFFPTNRSVNTL